MNDSRLTTELKSAPKRIPKTSRKMLKKRNRSTYKGNKKPRTPLQLLTLIYGNKLRRIAGATGLFKKVLLDSNMPLYIQQEIDDFAYKMEQRTAHWYATEKLKLKGGT